MAPADNWAPGNSSPLGEAWNTGAGLPVSASVVVDEESVSALVVMSPPGDYNSDGEVDADDYAVFTQSFGETGDSPADGNNDGVVNAIDYAIWRDAFAAVESTLLTSPIAIAQAPEPSAFLLPASAALTLTRRRRTAFG